jgi:hypothetical protein
MITPLKTISFVVDFGHFESELTESQRDARLGSVDFWDMPRSCDCRLISIVTILLIYLEPSLSRPFNKRGAGANYNCSGRCR